MKRNRLASLRIATARRRVTMADGLYLEWRSSAVPAGEEGGVQVRPVRLEGVDGVQIDAPPDTGWLRLVCGLGADRDAPLLGLRLLMQITPVRRAETVQVRLVLVPRPAQPETGPDLPPAPQAAAAWTQDLRLAAGQWHDLRGLFLCAPPGAQDGFDLMLRLPDDARILLAGLEESRLAARLSPQVASELAATALRPVAAFEAQPVTHGLRSRAGTPAVLAHAARLRGTLLSGWVLADSPAQIVVGATSPLAQHAPLQMAEVMPGIHVVAGFTADVAGLIAGQRVLAVDCQFPGLPGGVPRASRLADLPVPLPFALLHDPAAQPEGADPRAGVPGALRGHLEQADAEAVAGWIARDPATETGPQPPLWVTLALDGVPVAAMPASLPRPDVEAAGFGPEASGFHFALPAACLDGASHHLRVTESATGRLLPGGERRLAFPREGAVFLDRQAQTIAGWSRSPHGVVLRLDGGPAIPLRPAGLVPGFGPGERLGFALPVPPALADGGWHRVEAEFAVADAQGGQVGTGIALDGAPLAFRLDPLALEVEAVLPVGIASQPMQLRLAFPPGASADAAPGAAVGVIADGVRLRVTAQKTGQKTAQKTGGDILRFSLPLGTRSLLLQDERHSPPLPLARFIPALGPDGRMGLRRIAGLADLLASATLDAPGCAAIRAAFAGFCAGERPELFDAPWYLASCPGASEAVRRGTVRDALHHYALEGHRQGQAPHPFFDEAEARRLYPQIAEAILAGRIPCAFAVALVTGLGLADPEEEGRPDAAAPPPPDPEALLPDIAEPLYAAVLAGVQMPAAARARLAQEETDVRAAILAHPLAHAPLVSILLPTRNRAALLAEAIRSVQDQSYPHWELLICDGDSTDRTAEVVRSFEDPRLRYLPGPDLGVAGARNRGLALARGSHLALLDSDSLWHPQFLDVMLRLLLAAPTAASICCGRIETRSEAGRSGLVRQAAAAFQPLDLLHHNRIAPDTVLLDRRVTDWLGGFDESLPLASAWEMLQRCLSVFPPLLAEHSLVLRRLSLAWEPARPFSVTQEGREAVRQRIARRVAPGGADVPRLRIAWPGRGRIAVLAGGSEADSLLAAALAGLLVRDADVDLIDLWPGADPPQAGADPALRHHALPPDLRQALMPLASGSGPERLAYALTGLGPVPAAGVPLLGVGGEPALLDRLEGCDIWQLRAGAAGLLLQNRRDGRLSFPLGALPVLPLPAEEEPGLPPCALLICRPGLDPAALAPVAAALGLDLLIVPPLGAPWLLAPSGGGPPVAVALAEGLRRACRCRLAVTAAAPAALDPFALAVLCSLQAGGVPMVIAAAAPAGPVPPGDLATQWIAAGAALGLALPQGRAAGPEPDLAADLAAALAALLADPAACLALGQAGRQAAEALHSPGLLGERLAHVLFRLLFDPPRPGVLRPQAAHQPATSQVGAAPLIGSQTAGGPDA